MANKRESSSVDPRLATIQVRGEVILAILESTRSLGDAALKILGRHRLPEVAAGRWYPLDRLLDVLAEIESSMTDTTLYTIGHKIHRNAVLPDVYGDFLEALERIDEAYHLNHQGGEIGHYRFSQPAARQVLVVSTSLYPCEFDRGVVHGFAGCARPADIRQLTVSHSPLAPCRRRGGASCTYTVDW
jgi:hypothetical protein